MLYGELNLFTKQLELFAVKFTEPLEELWMIGWKLCPIIKQTATNKHT